MKSADLETDGAVIRFVSDDSGTFLEVPSPAGSERRRCSPYHLYCVLCGESYDLYGTPVHIERQGEDVSIDIDGTPVAVPADCYEMALYRAFGIGRS